MSGTGINDKTKILRIGVTTGSCAAAASKAAARMLLSGTEVSQIDLETPAGIVWRFDIIDTERRDGTVSCAVIKDSGDDPDITNGVKVFATITLSDLQGVEIRGGKGIGTVTRPGLDQGVGEAAINSVPRRMITEAVEDELAASGSTKGAVVTISIPAGEELAHKTFNPKLGIVGGISVIGTSGIVRPMSEDAIRATILTEIKVRRAENRTVLPLVFGNYGEMFLERRYGLKRTLPVTCSNYVRDAVRMGVDEGFTRILLTGHIGKLIKVAAGMPNTHSKYGDPRTKTMLAAAKEAGITDAAVIERIGDAVTTEDALDALEDAGVSDAVCDILTGRIAGVCGEWAGGGVRCEIILFRSSDRLLGETNGAEALIDECRE